MTLRALSLTDADVFAGTERLILELSSAMDSTVCQALIGCPQPSPLAEFASAAGIKVVAVGLPGKPKGFRADWLTVRRLASLIGKRQVDLIHVHNGRSALIAAVAGAGRNVPMVMSQHFLSPARTTRRGIKAILSQFVHGWLEKRLNKHIAISDAVCKASVVAGVAPENKLTVVLNGIRRPVVDPAKSTWRSELWPEDGNPAPFVFCAARAEPEKDLPTLVRAIESIRTSHPNIRCLIAGGGRELESVQSLINTGGLSSAIRILGFRKDVEQLMHDCSIFVLPATAEPFGLVLLEAMALGKAVIACDAGGPREIVEHGVTGLLVPPGDHIAMGKAIAKLLDDPELAQRMGAAGEARYKALFTADVMAKRMVEVYRDVLDEWKARRGER